MPTPLRKIITSVFVCLVLTSFLIPGGIAEALAQELTCQERLTQADEQYMVGRFEDVIDLLKSCVEDEAFTEEEEQRAYRLLSLSYLGKDLADDARNSIRKLLELVPNYQADLEQDPPQFARMLDEIKEEMQPEPEPEPEPEIEPEPTPTPQPVPIEKKNNTLKWVAIGGGVVLAGVLAAVLLGGGSDGENGGNGPGPVMLNEREPNNLPIQAQVLPRATVVTVNGQVAPDDILDFYRVTISQPGLQLALRNLSADVDLSIWDAGFNAIIDASAESDSSPEFISQQGLAVGSYLILVDLFDDLATSSYQLIVTGAIEGSDANLKLLQTPDVATVASSYRLVGHPGNVEAEMSATLAEAALTEWTAFHEDGTAITEYDGSETFRFRPGGGFWVRSQDALRFAQTTPPVPLDDGASYTIALHPGWNIISNPFYAEVDWNAVQAANHVTQGLWRWDGHYALTDAFASAQHGEAYYFMNTTNRETLTIPYPGAANPAWRAEPRQTDVLSLTAYRDGQQAAAVQVGLAYEARAGFDAYDQLAPPSYFETASLRLEQRATTPTTPALLLGQEFRPNNGEDQRFELLLEAPVGEPITLEVGRLSAFAGYEIYLFDTERSTFYNLRQQPTLTLTPLTQQSRYVLMMGSTGFIQTMRQELAPTAAVMSNAPNPFNPSTQISYTVPASSSGEQVRLEVYNILGQLVQTLVDAPLQAGSYTVTWDGTDASRTPVASGTYLYRLQMGSFRLTKTMQLLK